MAGTAFRGGSYLVQAAEPDAVFTPEDFSEEQRLIAETAQSFAEDIRGRLKEIEADKPAHSRSILREAGKLGLLGLEVPEEYGGAGLDKITATAVTEAFGWAGSFAITIGAHTGIGTLPIVYFGTPEQKARYLPRLATGEWVAAYALTEPGSGSDALGARTTARLSPDGRHWVLNGTKQWITNAGFADVFIVYAKVDGEKFSAFIVERTFPGVSVGPEEDKLGLNASSTCSLILEDALVPVENLLGEIGRGHVIAFNILNLGRWKLGTGCVGSAKYVLSLAAEYARTRQQFGRPIAQFRAIQQKLAEMNIRTFVAESLVYRTAGLIDARPQDLDEYAVECSVSKVFGSEALDFLVDEAVQIHGGYGFMNEYPVSTAARDSRLNRIFEGTNEINRLLIPGTLIRRTLKGGLPELQKAMADLPERLMNITPFEESDEPLAQERFLIDRAKTLFLLVAGLGVQRFGKALEQEQELLLGAADIAIEVYAMESAVLRALKEGGAGLKSAMAQVYCQEAFERIGSIARSLLPALEDGDGLRMQISMVKRLTRYTPPDVVGLRRQVAARVVDRGGYCA